MPKFLEGARELEKALFELKTATAKSVARRVLKSAGQVLAQAASDVAPERTGHLAESYVVTSRLNKAQSRARRGESRDQVEMYVGTNDPAGVQQEFGNRTSVAQPHFRPAWEANKQAMLEQIGRDLAQQVEKSVARARRKAARLK